MKKKALQWYGDEQGHVGYPDCSTCLNYLQWPGLMHAAASVGIEHGKSTGEMVRLTVDQYHRKNHHR